MAGAGAAMALATLSGGCAYSQDGSVESKLAVATDVFRIGVGSCINQDLPQVIWPAVLAEHLDLFVFGGDTVYASEQPFSLDRLNAAYAKQQVQSGFARLRASVAHLSMWDDHDYGLNDGGAAFEHKQASKDAFLRFWNIAQDDPRRQRQGLYHAAVFGPAGRRVQIILLDTRWFRSPWKPTDLRDAPGRERYLPDPDPGKTMLGAEQWDWLAQQLKVPAEVRLVVSGIQVMAQGHGWECWANFPHELQRLFDSLRAARANGVVLVSGDRHFGALYRDRFGMPYPVTELTTSGMTHSWQGAKEAGPNRLGDLFDGLNYGLVEVDWTNRQIRLLLKDELGHLQRSAVLALDALQVPLDT
jgi:alkaline phosphatase D